MVSRKKILREFLLHFFSTKTSKEGSGFGLAFCRGIIEKLGGSISATSDIGKCTVFTVRLPIDSRKKEKVINVFRSRKY